MNSHLDLRQQTHPACRSLTRDERDDTDQDCLCRTLTSVLDDLPIRPVGEWAYDKIYRLVQYFGIFAGGMKNQWAALNYIEIGCGPGRCLVRDDCSEIDGTALAIMRNPHFSSLQKATFIDASPRVAEILNARIKGLATDAIASAVVGDYEDGDGLCRILKDLPERSLNFVFIDPTECDIPFETIEQIVRQLKNADFLVNVALGTDVNRNLVPAILSPSHARVRAKYERFLGTPGFCQQPEVVDLPRTWKKARRIFVNSMSDLFHPDVPLWFVQRVFKTMEECPQHSFQVLTKRSDRVRKLAAKLAWPHNVWMGVSVEDSRVFHRIDDLRDVPAAIRFLSCEPLIGSLAGIDLRDIHWVIVGGESGPHSRPMDIEWVREIFRACRKQKVPFFFKQWGGVQKHRTGRELRGRTYDEMPLATAA